MQSRRVRLAYLRRMIRRVPAEVQRLENLRSAGAIPEDHFSLLLRLVEREHAELLAELRRLEEDKASDSS
jgi:hypothetical protein